MSKSKNSFLGSGSLLLGAGLLAGYIIYKGVTSPKEGLPQGSLGGTDELLEQQGSDIDPNSTPDQYVNEYNYYVIVPDGTVVPENKTTTEGGSGNPSNVPIASTGTGSLFQDTAVVGGAIGANIFLPSIAKRVNSLIDTKYISDKLPSKTENKLLTFIKDPYQIDDLAVSKSEKIGSREVASLAINTEGKTLVKTIPKWAKAVRGVSNFIPLVDIPIGASLDVYFSRNMEDEKQKIDWLSAIKANTAGELAQLGLTGAATITTGGAGTIPVWIAGTGVDIATTEAVYSKMGFTQTSLFGSSFTPTTPATNNATYNASTQVYTNSSGQLQSMPASSPQAKAAVQVSTPSSSNPLGLPTISNPFISTGSSGGSSSSNVSTSAPKTSTNVTTSSSATTTSTAKASAPAAAPSVSVISKVSSAVANTVKTSVSVVTSVASKVSSFFSGGRRK